MKDLYRYVGFVFLAGALTAPAPILARATPQEEEHHDKDKRRVYDEDHKDYHNWDSNEDHRYRQYLGEQKMEYREYQKLDRDHQSAYWNWRHSHTEEQDKH